jgi:hypothetical protein
MTPAPAHGTDPGPVDSPGGGGPVKFASGNLWVFPDGALKLTYRIEETGELGERLIPAGIMRMIGNGAGPVAALRALAKVK